MTYRVIYPYNDYWELEKTEKIIFPRRTLREIYEKDIVIIVRADKAIEGRVNGKRNVLVWNFWQLLNGMLTDVAANIASTAGAVTSARTHNDPGSGSAYVTFGTGTTPEAYDQYSLASRSTAIEGAIISPSVIAEANQYRIRFGRVSAGTVYEVGLYQGINPVSGTVFDAMFGRVVYLGGIPSGKNVYYDILVKPPFLRNLIYYLFGTLTDTTQNLVDRTGATFTARIGTDPQSGGLFMKVGTGTGAFDFSTYDLTNPLDCVSATNFYWADKTYSFLQASGAVRFVSAYTVSEVGVYQNMYDTGGAIHPTLLMRFVLP
ncbi:MAG: hypothetical protein C0179_04645, partial [Fervidicoccus sp.]